MNINNLKIIKAPNPILNVICEPVKTVTNELMAFSGLLLCIMVQNGGIGLAAPQVGKSIQLIVIDTKQCDPKGHTLVMFNPKIISKEGHARIAEGCLSLPGESVEVDRSAKITVEYINIMNQKVIKDLEGITAICAQHEIDHLLGILMTSYKNKKV